MLKCLKSLKRKLKTCFMRHSCDSPSRNAVPMPPACEHSEWEFVETYRENGRSTTCNGDGLVSVVVNIEAKARCKGCGRIHVGEFDRHIVLQIDTGPSTNSLDV